MSTRDRSGTTAGRWTKLYASLINGRALVLSRDARLLAVEAEAWADDQETDGALPRAALARLTDLTGGALDDAVGELVAAGYWEEDADGWAIEGFLDRHDASEARAEAREMNAARLKGWREHQAGRHNPNGPRSCRACSDLRGTATNDFRNNVRSGTSREAKRQRSEAYDGSRERSASAKAPASARDGQPVGSRPPSDAELEDYDRMLDGELCWHCGNPDPIQKSLPVGRLDGSLDHRRTHGGRCDPPRRPDWGECESCMGRLPLAWLRSLDDDPDIDEEGLFECMPDRGCGGFEAEWARSQRELEREQRLAAKRGEKKCPACFTYKPGDGFEERTLLWDDGREERTDVCADCAAEAPPPSDGEDAGSEGPDGPLSAEGAGLGGETADEDAAIAVGDEPDGVAQAGRAERAPGKRRASRGGDVGSGQGDTSSDGGDSTDRTPGRTPRPRKNLR